MMTSNERNFAMKIVHREANKTARISFHFEVDYNELFNAMKIATEYDMSLSKFIEYVIGKSLEENINLFEKIQENPENESESL